MIEPQTNEPEPNSSDSSEMPDAPSEAAERDERYFEEPDTDATVPITSPAPEAMGDPTRYSRRVGEGNAGSRFPARTRDEAEASAEAIAAFCRNCPISHKCAEDGCAVYRAEIEVMRVLEEAEGRTAVGGVVIPAQPGASA